MIGKVSVPIYKDRPKGVSGDLLHTANIIALDEAVNTMAREAGTEKGYIGSPRHEIGHVANGWDERFDKRKGLWGSIINFFNSRRPYYRYGELGVYVEASSA